MAPEPRVLRMTRALFAPRVAAPLERAMFATACILAAPIVIAATVIEVAQIVERIGL